MDWGLVVAIAALAVSVGAVLYARRSANEARRMRQIEEQRHHGDRRPKIELRFTGWVSEPNLAWLEATNHGGVPVEPLRLEIVGGPSLAGFGDNQPPLRQFDFRHLDPGVSESVLVATVDGKAWPQRQVVLRVTPMAVGGKPWDTDVQIVNLPPPKPRVVVSRVR